MRSSGMTLFACAAVLSGTLSVGTDASAWFQRIPGFMCNVPASGYSPSVEVSTFVACPMFETDLMPDTGVTSVSVDLENPTAYTEEAGTLTAYVCTEGNLEGTGYGEYATCTGGVTSPEIAAGGHGSISISGSTALSAWVNDSENSEAFILGVEESGYTNYIVGVFIEN